MPKITNAATERHHRQMETLAEFLELDEIRYEDLGNGEDYHLTRGGKTLPLHVRGNRFDGGFLSVPVEGMEPLVMGSYDGKA